MADEFELCHSFLKSSSKKAMASCINPVLWKMPFRCKIELPQLGGDPDIHTQVTV